MLNNNGMRPAFATSGAQGFSNADRSKMNDYVSFSESDSDDFNAFGSGPQNQKAQPKRPQPTKNKPQKQPKPPVKIPVKAILAACGILAAIVLIIVITVAIFSAPKKEIRIEDNAYFKYIESSESGDVTRIVSNGKLVKQSFNGAVEIIPAMDYSFAYIIETVADNEIYTYVLKGTKVEAIGGRADEVPELALLEPGIVYKQGSQYYYQTPDDFKTIAKTDTGADNIIISNDAKTVVYTEISQKDGNQILKYFRNGDYQTIYSKSEIIPQAISNDGKYVFASNGYAFVYFEIAKATEDEAVPQEIFSNANDRSTFQGIDCISTDGKEIVFYANNNGKIMSYLYKMSGKGSLTEIGEGVYTWISADQGVVCPDTFVNSYFERSLDVAVVDPEDDDEDEENTEDNENILFQPTVTTYFFDKNGARAVADAKGQFSPDKKFFYYIDEMDNLVKVPLNSKDFKKDAQPILNSVSAFKIIEKGDLYAMHTNEESGKAKIFFVDASTGKSPSIADNVDPDSMQYCANSIYFSITQEDQTTIYVSTNGSAKEAASFKSGNPTETPMIAVSANGMGESAYAYFADASGSVKLYYTSNGKKFSLVAENCTIEDLASLPSTDNNKDSETKETEAE